MRDLVDEVEYRLPFRTQGMQGKAEENGEQQYLQDVALGKGVDHGVGNDIEQELGGALHLARAGVGDQRFGVQRRRIDVHAGAWLHQVHDQQSDDQRQAADHFEIKQRQAAGLTHRLHVCRRIPRFGSVTAHALHTEQLFEVGTHWQLQPLAVR